MSNKMRHILLMILIFLIAIALGLWAHHNGKTSPMTNSVKNNENLILTKTATVLPQPRPIQKFQLVDDHTQPFTNENLQDHWTLVFFGFTHCPSICPTTLAVLNQAYQQMQTAKLEPLPRVLFISVDPEQDSPAVIRSYVQGFNKNFLGATGTKAEIDALTQQFSVMYMKVAAAGDAGKKGVYSIDHSGTILVVDPKGELFAVFSTPHVASHLVEDMQVIERDYAKTQE